MTIAPTPHHQADPESQLAEPAPQRRVETVQGPAGPIEVHVTGAGQAVVLLPSLGRGAEDFEHLATALGHAGYLALAPQPRGIGASTSPLDNLSMNDLADDVAAVIRAFAAGPATVVGHAFGNRVARMVATDHPELVESVVLLACGGLVPPDPDHNAALARVFDFEAAPADRRAAIQTAFFAPGNDASVWHDGWHGIVAYFQGQATTNQPVEHWWAAGAADVLVVQPADHVIAVAENARLIVEQLGTRASLVTIRHAGHALLPEQPEKVADAILSWLANRSIGR